MSVKLFATALAAGLCGLLAVSGTAAEDTYVPTDAASREILKQTSGERTLRLAGLDIFPRALGSVAYDDNILIAEKNETDDVIFSLEPGFAITAGDIGAYLPGSVTLEQLRTLLYFSLVDDTEKPRRFAGLDYAPTFNFYADNSRYNNTGHDVKFTGGYAFTRFALGIDTDYVQQTTKSSSAGTLLETSSFDTRVRARYDLSDRTWLENQARYYWFDYDQDRYQGYQEVSDQAWFRRRFADRLSLGAGLEFGLVFPEESADQVYEQVLAGATYRLTEKLFLNSAVGMEFRQYDSDQSGTVSPVFVLATIYRPRISTTLTVEAHRRDEPSPYGGYNQTTLGGSVGVRQTIYSHLFVSLAAGYDNIDYHETDETLNIDRNDDYLSARLAVEYEFNRHLFGSLFYEWRHDDSSVDLYSYNNNVAGAQFSWRF